MNVFRYAHCALDQLRRGEARTEVVVSGALLTLVVFLVDLFVPLGIAGGVPYIAPVFLAMWLPDRRLIPVVATACSLLVIVGLWLSPMGVDPSVVFSNRILALAAIWTVAILSLQRKGFEEALARSEATNRAVLATTADGILTLDAQGAIASANPAAERIFGYPERVLLGRPFTDLLGPEYREPFERDRKATPRLTEQPSALSQEVSGRHESGAGFPMEVSLVPVVHEEGARHTVTVRDISDRRLLEQHLLRASDEERRALGQSLHEELGQSLTGLSLISRQLARRLEDRSPAEASEVAELAALLHEVDQQALALFQTVAPLDAKGNFGDALEELADATARRHGVPIAVQHDGLEAPFDDHLAAQLYLLVRDLLNTSLECGEVERIRVQAGREGDGCWLRLDLKWRGGAQVDWAECIRPLTYRAKLIEVRMELGTSGSEGSTVTCRWSTDPPSSVGTVPRRRAMQPGVSQETEATGDGVHRGATTTYG